MSRNVTGAGKLLCVALGIAFLVLSVSATAQIQGPNPAFFERFLIPVSVGNAPGAYGSLWDTELWYRNNSNYPVVVTPLWETDRIPTIGQTEGLPLVPNPAWAPGQFLWVSREGSDKVQFDLRLMNRADPTGDWGVKIPVVREGQFLDSVEIINVPTSSDFRSALRIYALDETLSEQGSVTVRIYSHLERLLVSADIPLSGSPRYAAILSLADAFPEIRRESRVRVHIEPRDPGARLWAFVSVVSNRTQHVSIVTAE
jgi:hypothetical protein